MKRFAFSKDEKLSSLKVIDALFKSGKSTHNKPVRFIWNKNDNTFSNPMQVVFIVSKKNIREATRRNRIRRQMKEIFRLHKAATIEICNTKKIQIALAIIFQAKIPIPFKELEHKIILLLHRLDETLLADDQ